MVFWSELFISSLLSGRHVVGIRFKVCLHTRSVVEFVSGTRQQAKHINRSNYTFKKVTFTIKKKQKHFMNLMLTPPRANDGADVSPVLDLVNALIVDKKNKSKSQSKLWQFKKNV